MKEMNIFNALDDIEADRGEDALTVESHYAKFEEY